MKMLRAPLLALALLGCSTSPEDLQAKDPPETRVFAENYQEIFRRVSNEAKKCMTGSMGPYASMQVNAQLYPDLGFGELSIWIENLGTRNYYVTAKIEKADSGSKVTVTAGNVMNADNYRGVIFKWASGERTC